MKHNRLMAAATLLAVLGAALPASAARKVPAARKAAAGSPASRAYRTEASGELKAARASIARLKAVQGPRTVANTLDVWNEFGIHMDRLINRAGLFQEVHPDSMVRDAAQKMVQEGSKLVSEVSTDPAVYAALKAVDVSGQDAGTKFMAFKALRDFRRSGVDKDDSTRFRLRRLNDDLVLYSQKFDLNISADKSTIEMDPRDLEGMPEDYIKGHPAGSNGKVTLTTAYPDIYPFLTYARSNNARRDFQKIFQNRAYPANIGVLDTLLQKRQEYAATLGYPNWAAYTIETNMIGSDTAVATFLDRLAAVSKAREDKDLASLLERKKKDDPTATRVNYWEGSYYSELVKREQYKFDAQEVRPYFEYNRVKKGILGISARMFGVEFRQVKMALWHPSVETYDVFEGGKKIGRFHLDMHPRANKFSHAANFQMVTGIKGRQYPEACLVCNFPDAHGKDPALMEHDDVETFFHEFGHLLHHIFGGQQRWISNSGVATEQDFVEAPSQMLEEWVWDTAVLQTFARHYKTGQPIPAEMVQRMREARDFGKGITVRQQLYYAGLSLNLHNREARGLSSDGVMQEQAARYSPWGYVPETHMQCSFGHLTGYSAVYYTYQWSLAIAKDMFSAFKGHDLLSPETATRYRKTVLAAGGSAPAAELVHQFLGRDFGVKAYEDYLNN